MRHALGRVLALACGTALSACTFPDVDYGDGGAGGSSSSGTEPCMELPGCTDAAASCAALASGTATACVQHCKNNPACMTKCAQQLTGARASCATTCESCLPSCSTATSACRTSAGL